MEIIINDVTLRDGLQNETYFVDTENKVKLINMIIDSGISHLEITSFVNPKLIPQLRDSFELANHPHLKNAYFSALVPNIRGFKQCVKTKIKEAVLFISACEQHNFENLGKSIDESLKKLKEIFIKGKDYNINFRAAISMVFGSPFLNNLPYDKNLFKIIDFFLENNVSDITLSDTWGNANKDIFSKQLEKILNQFKFDNFSIHLHDISGKGIVNAEVSLDNGIRKFDTSFRGLGGCPFSPEKGGNLNIRDLLKICDKRGIKYNIDTTSLAQIENFLFNISKLDLQVQCSKFNVQD